MVRYIVQCLCVLYIQVVTHELVPGGSGVPVSAENRSVSVPVTSVKIRNVFESRLMLNDFEGQ